jgi:hypothetical protein
MNLGKVAMCAHHVACMANQLLLKVHTNPCIAMWGKPHIVLDGCMQSKWYGSALT